MLAVTLYLRKQREKWFVWADIVAPCLILGYAIGRIGCLLVGDDYGIPTDLPWGMTFPKGAPPTLEAVHPTQIYETIMGCAIFFTLWKLRLWNRPSGSLFAIYLILAGTERFIIEFIRTNQKYLIGLSGAQIISVIMFIIGAILLIKLEKTPDNGFAAEAETPNPN